MRRTKNQQDKRRDTHKERAFTHLDIISETNVQLDLVNYIPLFLIGYSNLCHICHKISSCTSSLSRNDDNHKFEIMGHLKVKVVDVFDIIHIIYYNLMTYLIL